MKSNIGKCGLCLETNELIDSHLFPAAIYKHLNEGTDGRTNKLVMIRPGKAFFSCKQASSYFLCSSCEGKFNKGGEHYVLSQYALSNSQFKLRELLLNATPLQKLPNCVTYDLQSLIGGMVDQYLYFAASIFWRSSAHSWEINGKPISSITLGASYQEQFRKYLIDQASFPMNARLFISVATDEYFILRTFTNVCTERIGGAHRHKFYIPGLVFSLFLGQNAPKNHDKGSFNGTQGYLVHLRPWQNDSLFRGVFKRIVASRPLGKLSKRD